MWVSSVCVNVCELDFCGCSAEYIYLPHAHLCRVGLSDRLCPSVMQNCLTSDIDDTRP